MVSTGKAAARKLIHARVLLLADESEYGPGWPNTTIKEALGVSERTIERIRKRFIKESFEASLQRQSQPPRPDKVKIQGPLEDQLIQMACSDPPPGRSHWTLQLLAEQLAVLGFVDKVSTETVRKVLKKKTFRLEQ